MTGQDPYAMPPAPPPGNRRELVALAMAVVGLIGLVAAAAVLGGIWGVVGVGSAALLAAGLNLGYSG